MSCRPGFQPAAAEFLCGSDGNFSGAVPSCQALNCLSHGRVKKTETAVWFVDSFIFPSPETPVIAGCMFFLGGINFSKGSLCVEEKNRWWFSLREIPSCSSCNRIPVIVVFFWGGGGINFSKGSLCGKKTSPLVVFLAGNSFIFPFAPETPVIVAEESLFKR